MRLRPPPLSALPAACVLALGLAACSERHPDPAAPGRSTTFTIRWRDAVAGTMGDAFARVDRAHVSVTAGATVLLDTVAPFSGGGDTQLALPVRLQDVSSIVVVAVELLAGSDVLYRGEGSAELRPGAIVSLALTVAPVVAGVTSPDSASLSALGDTLRLRGVATLASGDTVPGVPVSWSGDGGTVVRVTTDGVVTALREGRALATVACHGFTHVTAVLVHALAASLAVSADSVSLYVDSTRTLTAVARDRNGNALSRVVSWSSSSPAVATVEAGGLVRAVAPGSATITASTEGQSARARVTVGRVPLGSVQVTPATAQVTVGDTLRLTAATRDITGKIVTDRPITWSADDSSVATVDTTGLVRARSEGKALITAASEGRMDTTLVQTWQPVVGASVPQLMVQARPGGAASVQTVAVNNLGKGSLSGLTVNVAYGSAATGWVTAALSATRAPTTLSVTVDPGGLPEGNYNATITVASTVPGSGKAQIGVALAVERPRVGVSTNAVLLQVAPGAAGAADSLVVANAGTGTLTGVVANVAYAAGEPTGWLTLSPSSWATVGTGGARMGVAGSRAVAGGATLGVGSYHATVTISSSDAGAGTARVAVTLDVQAAVAADVTYPVLHSSVRFWNTSFVSVSAGSVSGNTATVPPGAAIRVRGSWQIGPVTDISYCPYCVIEVYAAWLAPAGTNGATPLNVGLWLGILYLLDPNPGAGGTFDFTTRAPSVPGTYYLGAGTTLDYVYQPWASGGHGWVTGGPTTNRAVSFRIDVR